MASNMPWIPANMTPERRRKVEAFSRYRRIGRAEAAALLIDAGIEAMRPVVEEELDKQRRAIRERTLPDAAPERPHRNCNSDLCKGMPPCLGCVNG